MDVSCKNLTKIFGLDSYALRSLDLHIESGDFTVVMGESGSGKSTLLRVIAGLEKCTGICAAFSEKAGGGYSFVIGSKTIALRAHAKEITSALGGRGGGSDQMLSGTVLAPHDEIIRYIEQFRG